MDKFIECSNSLIKINNMKYITIRDERESFNYKNRKEIIAGSMTPLLDEEIDMVKKSNEEIEKFPYRVVVTFESEEHTVFRSPNEEDCNEYLHRFSKFIEDKTASVFRIDTPTFTWFCIENEDFKQSSHFHSYSYDQAIRDITHKVKCNLQHLSNILGDNVVKATVKPDISTINNADYYIVTFDYTVNGKERKMTFYLLTVIENTDSTKESIAVYKSDKQEESKTDDYEDEDSSDPVFAPMSNGCFDYDGLPIPR